MLGKTPVSESLRETAFSIYFLGLTISQFGPTALVIHLFAFNLRG